MLQPGIRQRARVRRVEGRRAPVEYADAVEQWAREHGGHAKLKWLPHPMNCWAVILSFKVGDPRQATDQDGEPVLLHEWWTADEWARRKPTLARRHPRSNAIMPGNYAYELDELGVEGLRKWLDKGNILSGRGEFRSVEEAGRKSVEAHETSMAKVRAKKREQAGHMAKDVRRQVFKIPFLKVGVTLKGTDNAGAA